MFLRYRAVGVADLPECLRCIRDLFVYTEEEKEQLVAMWRDVIATGRMFAGAVEDAAAAPGQRIVWFCTQACVSDEYACYLKTDAPPFLGREILRAWQRGETPLLSAEEARRANHPGGSGVNLIAVNSGSPPEILNGPGWTEVASKLVGFTEYFATGYNVREVLEEFYDPFTYAMIEGAGFRVKNEYAYHYERTGDALPPPHRRPRLYGVNFAEAQASAATLAHMIFCYKPPRLFLKPAEQKLLLHALLGETDEEVASQLGLSRSTIKKRWQSIYERAEAVAPEVFFGAAQETGKDSLSDARRGAEKRRYLLEYVRHHMEEIRPVVPYGEQ